MVIGRRMRATGLLPCMVAILLLSGCGSREFAMPYSPTQPLAGPQSPGGGSVAVAQVTNQRATGREDPNWIGTIRGGYGNPLHTLNANQPIDRVVRQGFTEALSQRGLLSSGEPNVEMLVTIRQFDANRYVRMEATADFRIALRDRSSGQVLWEDEARVYNLEGSILALDTGIFASPDALHALMLRTMNQAIDQLVDKPGFRSALVWATPQDTRPASRGRTQPGR